MSMTFRFREFKVYQDARKFRQFVRGLLKRFPANERFGLEDQISRSCHSVLLNIAEGSAKASDRDFARFLGISAGSVNEVVAGFDLALDDGLITTDDYSQVEREAENIVKQLGGFMKKLRVKS